MDSLAQLQKSKFSQEDKDKLIKFLKLIKDKGRFEHTATEAVDFVQTWLFVEQTILGKITANILGEIKIHENQELPEEPKKKATKKGK